MHRNAWIVEGAATTYCIINLSQHDNKWYGRETDWWRHVEKILTAFNHNTWYRMVSIAGEKSIQNRQILYLTYFALCQLNVIKSNSHCALIKGKDPLTDEDLSMRDGHTTLCTPNFR